MTPILDLIEVVTVELGNPVAVDDGPVVEVNLDGIEQDFIYIF